jgi:hypothetical protein
MILVSFGNSDYAIECKACIEGDVWCVMMIDQPFETSPCGFGTTINDAISNFKIAIRNEPVPRVKAKE